MLEHLLHVYLALVTVMTAAWAWQWKRQNAGIVDVVWAFGIGLGALYYGIVADGSMLYRLLVAMLGGIWAARLALYLLVRVLHEPEDGRYATLRRHFGANGQWQWFLFFQLQALVGALFTVPLLVAAQNPTLGFNGWVVGGVLIWLVAVAGEAIADAQLATFRANPRNRGRTCRVGLWRYSRHPNYFFEFLHWFSYALLAIGAPHGWLAWIGPPLMLAFLYRVTGIPYSEAQALRSRGDDYRRYQAATSAFFPWFPKLDAELVAHHDTENFEARDR